MRLDLIERIQIMKIVQCRSQKLIPVIHFRKWKYKSMLNALELKRKSLIPITRWFLSSKSNTHISK